MVLGRKLRAGVVAARTGRLESLGAPLVFAAEAARSWLGGGLDGARRSSVEVVVRDSQSSAAGARAASEELILSDGVRVVVTLGGSVTLPVVADTCERLATRCLSTTLPWQAYFYRRGGRWPTGPFGGRSISGGGVGRYCLDRVATIVYWTPGHQYRSSIDGGTAVELAHRYERTTGRWWSQPLGPAHALFEVVGHVLRTAADPDDRRSIAEALGRTRLATMAGTVDWTSGPVPNVATIPLAGGQWRTGDRPELAVVSNTRAPAVPRTGELVVRSR